MFMCFAGFTYVFGLCGFCDFYGFSLEKHKGGNQQKGKTCFCCFAYFDFFFSVFGVFQDVGNDMYIREAICMCRKKNACFWFFNDFMNFMAFFWMRWENAKAECNNEPKENA